MISTIHNARKEMDIWFLLVTTNISEFRFRDNFHLTGCQGEKIGLVPSIVSDACWGTGNIFICIKREENAKFLLILKNEPYLPQTYFHENWSNLNNLVNPRDP